MGQSSSNSSGHPDSGLVVREHTSGPISENTSGNLTPMDSMNDQVNSNTNETMADTHVSNPDNQTTMNDSESVNASAYDNASPPNSTENSLCGGGADAKKQAAPALTPADFKLLQVIGRGSFGKVFLVEKKDTGKIYAMKVLKKEQLLKRKQVAHTQTERRVLEQIEHPFIVSLRFAFQTQDKLYMVLDYFNGGELFFHLKANGRFSEELACFYAAEIVLALECLHKQNIVYRDLKPENVLLDADGHIRLTDFGLSKQIMAEDAKITTFCGTPEYLAPEIISGSGYNRVVDWWSLGTLLYEMLTGLPPFFNTNVHVMYEKILNAELKFPNYMSAAARDLLTNLLCRDPEKRLGATSADAADIRGHPFFAAIDWKALYNKEINSPFKPVIQDGEVDTGNIDDEFKKQLVNDTPVLNSGLKQRVNFPGFSYATQDNTLAPENAPEM